MTETERVKPRALATEEAIHLALESRWSEAVAVNRRIIDQHGPEEDACNRLGKALSELGRIEEAIAAYQQTVQLNPLNLIAPKMVRKLSALLQAPAPVEGSNAAIDVDLFTEEPGRSGLTVLTAPGDTPLGAVAAGDVVELEVVATALRARTAKGVALGEVETKLARRLVPLIQSGNRYEAAVARVDEARVEVMVRESHQAPENSRKTSFPIARGTRRDDYRPYAKESLLSTRGVDDESLEPDDDEPAGLAADDGDELEGMQTVEAELDDAGSADTFDDEDNDDESRPEDSY